MIRNVLYCREKKALDIEKTNDKFLKNDYLRVERYKDAMILPVKKVPGDNMMWGLGGVLNSDGEYVELSALPGRNAGAYEADEYEQSDKNVVYCGCFIKHWGHFLMDCVSRLWYCLEHDNQVDQYIFTTHYGNGQTEEQIKGNYKEFFALLGILDKVRIISTPTRFTQVIIPELSYFCGTKWSDEFCQIFDRISNNAMQKAKKVEVAEKVFFSRGHFGKAKKTEQGLDMLDDFFRKNGYSIIYPEELSLTEMIPVLRNAQICAFESGTMPHNMAFACSGQKVIIVERQAVVNHYQCDLDVMRDLNVTYIDGNFTIYPVFIGGGPFFLAFSKQMQQFASDYGYVAPAPKYTSDMYIKRCLRKYMKAYRKEYRELWGLESWQVDYVDAIYEAYCESCEVLGPYLSGQKIYTWKQLINWINWKIQIKKMIDYLIGIIRR